MERNTTTSPAPDLTPAAREARARRILDLTTAVFGEAREVQELPDGYTLGYPRDAEWSTRLQEFAVDAAQRLPALQTEVVERDGLLRLTIRGPDGTVEYVRAQLRARATRASSRTLESVRWKLRRLTSRMRMTPRFIIIGAARSGTTSLYSALAQHPKVAPALHKEISFFDLGYRGGLNRYRAYFPLRARWPGGQPLITGEASPTYMFSTTAAQRVASALPAVKLIATLRSPVERAHSHYNLAVRFGHETLSFEAALDREERGQTDWEFARYLAWGHYAEQLERWLAVFPRDQLLIVTLEQLKADRSGTYGRILDFLELPAAAAPPIQKLHSLPTLPMREETRERLEDYYRPYNARLREMLRTEFGWTS